MAEAKFEIESAPEQAEYSVPQDAERERVFEAFRRWGYLQADLDPLGLFRPHSHPELDLSGPAAQEARGYYCGSIGVEFAHISDLERRRWIEQRMESAPPALDQQHILERLIRADLFEQVMQSRYLGSKRFSLEGITVLIPLMDELLDGAAEHGAEQAVLGMSHRGRLNVITHIVGRAPAEIFANFEDVDPRSVLGGGDVKYHMGATGVYTTQHGHSINIHLVSNPSHLEAVDPVALGRVRAKQIRAGKDGAARFLAIVMHGDAAFAGQGIWAETLNFAGVKGYSIGGAIHIIVNNLIGFTTTPPELHTARFSADLARRQDIPIFHVNGEDPDAVVRVARMALEYRYQFGSDVIIDVIGYRRHGHSEIDDPTITQPLLYKAIEEHPPLWQIYAEDTGSDPKAQAEQVRAEYDQGQKEAKGLTKKPSLRRLPDYWANFKGGRYKPEYEVDTGVAAEEIAGLTEKLTTYPADFHVHPKIKRLLQQRAEMGSGKRVVDYGMAEALAFASLLKQGTPVRMSGQDTQRGTFNQRHAVLVDVENESRYIPLCHVSPEQARFEIYNSTLSEAGPLGFEYGYSRDYPETLVLWEAQFGDFANGAQIVIDQFISSGEDKWGLLSGLVLLLPHGHEGQGPEHSSARIERYLQLAARDNFQICQPSTAAQYFHLLRRQALRRWRKPLVVFTPKSMLRHPDASSPVTELSRPRFLPVLPDTEVQNAERLILCTGKIGHELRVERKRRKDSAAAIVFLEQLYPFPEAELATELERHKSAQDILWVQEEPANMGALGYVMPRLQRLAGSSRHVLSVKRSGSASPATGSGKAHEMEQKTLLTLAFTTGK
ncbi:MAG TPA: 2-oxoglutarate dehydrogenase E1 component [Terriglobales bacterium]|jgi:2-oxoglutarate dehydrogenase E1 component